MTPEVLTRSDPLADPPRSQWEIVAAGLLMVGALGFLDIAAIGAPVLLWSCTPFLFLMLASVTHLSPTHAAMWAGVCVLGALIHADLRFVGLAYPALVLAALQLAYRRWQPSGIPAGQPLFGADR
jgi:hypothetical protein